MKHILFTLLSFLIVATSLQAQDSPKKLLKWKDRWDEVQKTLGDYKYNQIIRSMSNNQEEMMEDNNTRRTDIGRTMDTFTFDDSYDELLGSTYFKFQDYDIWFGSDGEEITDDLTNEILDSLTPQDSYGSYEEWKKSKWYDKINLRGYTQIRYNRLFESNQNFKKKIN